MRRWRPNMFRKENLEYNFTQLQTKGKIFFPVNERISFFFFQARNPSRRNLHYALHFFDNSQKRELVAAGKLRQAFSTLLALLLLDGFYGPPLLTGSSIKCPICIRREEYSNYYYYWKGPKSFWRPLGHLSPHIHTPLTVFRPGNALLRKRGYLIPKRGFIWISCKQTAEIM